MSVADLELPNVGHSLGLAYITDIVGPFENLISSTSTISIVNNPPNIDLNLNSQIVVAPSPIPNNAITSFAITNLNNDWYYTAQVDVGVGTHTFNFSTPLDAGNKLVDGFTVWFKNSSLFSRGNITITQNNVPVLDGCGCASVALTRPDAASQNTAWIALTVLTGGNGLLTML
jgi:hypothetical protein